MPATLIEDGGSLLVVPPQSFLVQALLDVRIPGVVGVGLLRIVRVERVVRRAVQRRPAGHLQALLLHVI